MNHDYRDNHDRWWWWEGRGGGNEHDCRADQRWWSLHWHDNRWLMKITSQTALLRYLRTRHSDHRLRNATHSFSSSPPPPNHIIIIIIIHSLINHPITPFIHSFIHSFVDDDNDEVGNNKLRRDIVRSQSNGWWGWYVAIDFWNEYQTCIHRSNIGSLLFCCMLPPNTPLTIQPPSLIDWLIDWLIDNQHNNRHYNDNQCCSLSSSSSLS